jgi:VWFA-related protein
VYSTSSDLVVLHVVVEDRKGAPVPDLPGNAFTVLEDDRPQAIRFFGKQDMPVTAGLLIDNSGSMAAAREGVVAAAGTFVESSNPADEIFALVFNDRVRPALPPDAPFTNDPTAIRAALAKAIAARGSTALHHAVVAGLNYVERGTHQRQVLVLVADGSDNASMTTFDDVRQRIFASRAVIYTIALADPLERQANPKRLKRLAEATGGRPFQPRDTSEVKRAMHQIALDIRTAYSIGYVPANAARDGRFRRIRVIARAPDGRALLVRTRQGYLVERR